MILLSEEALTDCAFTQALYDVTNAAPVWTEAGYAMCGDVASDVTEWILSPDGDIVTPEPIPNITTSVNDCPISVLPARFTAVVDFISGTFESRLSRWFDSFGTVQTGFFSQNIDAFAALSTAASPVVQSSTQVGFALPEANSFTEWVLVLVVAVESLLVVLSALVAAAFPAKGRAIPQGLDNAAGMDGFRRHCLRARGFPRVGTHPSVYWVGI